MRSCLFWMRKVRCPMSKAHDYFCMDFAPTLPPEGVVEGRYVVFAGVRTYDPPRKTEPHEGGHRLPCLL